jgi:hypothetical protein
MEINQTRDKPRKIDLFISGIGAAICIVTTLTIWFSISSNQPMWLLPGAYFLELMVGALVCVLAILLWFPRSSQISWIYSGILVAFIVIGAFSVGFFYIPVFLLFGSLSIILDLRIKKSIIVHLGFFLGAAILQAVIMLVLIRI